MFKCVDILKFVFSLCVLCIHCGLLKGHPVYNWINPLLFRLAVPFFFVASGFFIGQKIYTDGRFNGFDKWGGVFVEANKETNNI